MEHTIIQPYGNRSFDVVYYKDIEKSIKKKEELLVKYRNSPCNSEIEKYWLIISVPEEFVIKFDIENIKITSSFDNVFVVDMFYHRQVLQLK